MKLVWFAYNHGDAAVQAEVQSAHNAIRSQDDWFAFDIGRAWVHSMEADFEHEERVWRGNRAVLSQADAVVCFLPPDTKYLPWEVGFSAVAGIPSIVVCSSPSDHFKSVPTNCLLVKTGNEMLAALSTIPNRKTKQKPPAKWRRIEHDTKNEDIHVEPIKAHHDDAGFDLTYDGHQPITLKSGEVKDVPCGVAIEWPPNTWGLLVGRSSTFRNRGLLCNPAIIDPGYRGHLFAIVRNISHEEHTIQPGERVAQIVPLPALAPMIGMQHSEELSESARGEKGFGSSGL